MTTLTIHDLRKTDAMDREEDLRNALAAKEAGIAALTQERDSVAAANYDYCTENELLKQRIAALREALEHITKHGSAEDARVARAALEMSGGVK